MTNPFFALVSLQEGMASEEARKELGQPNLEIFFRDDPNGNLRFTYAKIEDWLITAMVMFILIDPIDGTPCFQIGYAVPEALRRQGRAKAAIRAAIRAMKKKLSGTKFSSFWVEAIVGNNNIASKKVAEAIFSDQPVAITDKNSGLPALQFILHF